MFECSVCSMVAFICSCIYSTIVLALEYPITILLLSILIAAVLITNVHVAKLLCDFGNVRTAVATTAARVSSGRLRDNVDYGHERGPHTWNCPVDEQSPININETEVQNLPLRDYLTWNHYDDIPNSILLENTGHTVILRAFYSGNIPTICGADLYTSYTFVELRFRWSQLDSEGSEHMLNYRKFPLEIQAMHRAGPANEPTSSSDILMISYFHDLAGPNPFLQPLVVNLHRVQQPGSRAEIPPFPLSYLLYPFRTGFYSYKGSLTEPPCYQGTEWFVFPEPLTINHNQMNVFRSILGRDSVTPIIRNSRPVQNLNARVIRLNQYNPLEAADQDEDDNEEDC